MVTVRLTLPRKRQVPVESTDRGRGDESSWARVDAGGKAVTRDRAVGAFDTQLAPVASVLSAVIVTASAALAFTTWITTRDALAANAALAL